MAITVASDIVLDVMNAANPMRVKQAAAKLAAAQSAEASFDRELGKAGIASKLNSDIVMEAMAAADPARLAAASAKLANLSNNLALGAANRAEAMAGLRERLGADLTQSQAASYTNNSREAAYRDFEATVLRSFFEAMLPSTEGGFYGQGAAGNVWRSMSADYLGQEFAKSGGIGIARRLDRDQTQASASGAAIAPAPQWPYFSQSSLTGVEL
jgi:hypothetical protein